MSQRSRPACRLDRGDVVSACAVLLGLAVALGVAQGAGLDPLASARLEVRGYRLSIYSDAQTSDAEQTINAGERARVRTCFGLGGACGQLASGDPGTAGLVARAELRGPELPQPLPLETAPGGAFILPALQQDGDYVLENIRLVEATSGRLLQIAAPPLAIVHVRRIMLASATVTRLSLEDLRQRGISLSENNFQAFDFALGFAFGSETVTLEMPVLFTGNGTVEWLERPEVSLDGLPAEVAEAVKRWQPPQVVPFKLETTSQELLDERDEENEVLQFPIFGALVLPGSVSFLNQLFEARLIVANGAPPGAAASLADITATLRLPAGNVLRLAATNPPVSPGQPLPVIAAGGGRMLAPGEQGTAAWTVEGLVAGAHALQVDLAGELVRPGREPLVLASRAQAAVEVVDARFHLTFSHPSVVREGEAYSLFCTVTNLSRVPQNLIALQLRSEHMSGAHAADPDDDLRREIETLAPGEASTVELPLVADLTGEVMATTFQSASPAGLGTILLRAGVGELGIPLSPATLVLPRFSERLARPYLATDELLRANVRLLGLAYSLAVVPAGMAPAGLPHVTRREVEQRAVDLAEAGQRTFLGDGLLESLEVLALDQVGNRHPLAEIDALRRLSSKGHAAASALAAALRAEQAARGLDARGLLDHFAATTSYCEPFLAALLAPIAGASAPVLEVRQSAGGATTYLARTSDAAEPLRSLPFGEIYAAAAEAQGAASAQLALVGQAGGGQPFEIWLHNEGEQAAAGELLLLVPAEATGAFRRVDLGLVTVPPHSVIGVSAGAAVPDPGDGGFRLYYPATGFPVPDQAPAQSETVALPPFRLLGARQDFRLGEGRRDGAGNLYRPNRHGHGVSYLFNRPPAVAAAENPANYRIRSSFDGLDTAGQAAVRVHEKVGRAAFLQPSGRVVNLRYSGPISALLRPDGTQLVDHQHLLDTGALRDRWGNSLDGPVLPPAIEADPLHVGGLIEGRVLAGDGAPVTGVAVQLLRPRRVLGLGCETVLDLVDQQMSAADGSFYFDFVESPHWDGRVTGQVILRAIVPAVDDPTHSEIAEVSTVIRQASRLAEVNIALLGRGTVRGSLVDLDTGAPVVGGRVAVASTLFDEIRSATVSAEGAFSFAGMPVGPLTLTGSDRDARRVYATVGLARPGETVEVVLRLPRTQPPGAGTVSGVVLRKSGGALLPAVGARVAVYSLGVVLGQRLTDAGGRFRFTAVPAGQVSVQAADWTISRTPAFTDLLLGAGQEAELTLTLAEGEARAVTGVVQRLDPLANALIPVAGAVVFIKGPGVYSYTMSDGAYTIDGVPVQGVGEAPFRVTAIDHARGLEGETHLPPILDVSPALVQAQPIVLKEMYGGLDGVVLDPLGWPTAGVTVTLFPYGETTSGAGGHFSFEGIPVGEITLGGERRLVAHAGDGLAAPRVGFLGEAATSIVFAGHRPSVNIRLRGSGVLNVTTRTSSSTGVQSPVYYRPTYYSGQERRIRLRGSYLESGTDPNGQLQLVLPVGGFELVAYNPFHGPRTVSGSIDYPGQVKNLEMVFEDASTVGGTVVDVDGATPVAGAEVTLAGAAFLPRKQRCDALGRFEFALVPKGNLSVSAAALVGTVARVGVVHGLLTRPGQALALTVRMRAQGGVRGRVVERVGSELQPLAHAQLYITEGAYPNRRLPAPGGWLTADGEGRYELGSVNAGRVRVVARDSQQVERTGSAAGEITADWQVLEMPDVVISTEVGQLVVTVRDPLSGSAVADVQVTLGTGEATVTDGDGEACFAALPLGSYSVSAFHAPSGRSGRANLRLTAAGETLSAIVTLDQRGAVRGVLWADSTRLAAVPGGTVELSGSGAAGSLTALATTSGELATLGQFELSGIPEGHWRLTAAAPSSPRRAGAEVELTATAPVADLDLVLEPAGELAFRVFERLRAGLAEVDPAARLLSVRLRQSGYDFTQLQPAEPAPGHLWAFPEVLLERPLTITVAELDGEQRAVTASVPDLHATTLPGSGSRSDPFQLVLQPKGIVRVSVRDAAGAPVAGAAVTLTVAGGTRFPGVSASDGVATFIAVPAGLVTATATAPAAGFGGLARATLAFDDDLIDMLIELAPVVAAHGVVYQAVADDRLPAGGAGLIPAAGVVVEITDARADEQTLLTGADGGYRFAVLPIGPYTLTARELTGAGLAAASGSLAGPHGHDNEIPSLVLDASPPRIVSLAPPPGMTEVSRTATVEIVFSEPLLASVLPSGQPTSSYFRLRTAAGATAAGAWNAALDAAGQQVVTFIPNPPLASSTTYSLTITGGPSGVRDRAGRLLAEAGVLGSSFTTADAIGPQVIAVEPALERPVDPRAALRIDFNEAVVAGAEALDGDGVEDAAELAWRREEVGGALSWQPLPASLALTRHAYSLLVTPVAGLELAGDTLRRRLRVARLADAHGNEMALFEREFRAWDGHPPVIAALPAPAADGRLTSGTSYTLTPALAGLDDVTAANPGGDLDRVDYYLADPADPANPSQPIFTARRHPFSFAFVAAYAGNGVDPRPFPVWARAVDTSTNASSVERVEMVVLPNQPPAMAAVTISALAPVAGRLYAGSTARLAVSGLADPDGTQVTLAVELWQEGASEPLASPAARLVRRPASGSWSDLAVQSFDVKLPLTLAEGTGLLARARATDSHGAAAPGESEWAVVADDAAAPVLSSLVARLAAGGAARSHFTIGEELVLELRARDGETAVQAVAVSFDRPEVFPSPLAATLVRGSSDLYRTATRRVPVDVFTAET
ncbi:MAG: Ig-like domain-containing protein, partial [Acidobacteriota bacterium]